MSTINDRIKLLRVMKKLKQSEFAEVLETTQGNISYIESGQTLPTGELMRRLAQRYPDINFNWLISNHGTPLLNPTKIKDLEVEDSDNHKSKKKPDHSEAVSKIDKRKKDQEHAELERLKKKVKELELDREKAIQNAVNEAISKKFAELSKTFGK